MIDSIKSLFAPPDFSDPEDSRKARLLNAILLASISITGLYLPTLPLTNPNPAPGMVALFLILVILISMYFLFKRGNLEFTSQFLLVTIWSISSIAAYFYGGVISPSYLSLVMVIYAAAMLTNPKTAAYYTGVTILIGAALIVFENLRLLPVPTSPVTSLSIFAGAVLNLVGISLFTTIANRSTQESLDILIENQASLVEENQEMLTVQANLEATVSQRTKDLERRTNYLEAAAMVARDTTSILNQEKLLDRVVNLIAEKYNFYHVGIFLVNEDNQFAVLRAASSSGGKKMIERNHQLGVGKQGIVGFVTGIGQARISQDIEMDRIHSTTDELPDTRSEMALPLKIGGAIIGALDIQDTQPQAFSQDDVTTIQILADQVALAIRNAQLYEQAQSGIAEAKRVSGQYDQQSWLDSIQRGDIPSYRYSSDSTQDPEKVDPSVESLSIGMDKIAIPINVRGHNIGAIDIVRDMNSEWSEEEINLLNSLSDQIGVALDGARLFNEIQLRASNERIVSEISNEVRGKLDINSILKATAERIRETLDLPEVTIRLTSEQDNSNSNGASTPDSQSAT